MENLLEKHYDAKQAGALLRISSGIDKKDKQPTGIPEPSSPEPPSMAYLFGDAIARSSTPQNEPFPDVIKTIEEPPLDRGKGGPTSRVLNHQREVKGF